MNLEVTRRIERKVDFLWKGITLLGKLCGPELILHPFRMLTRSFTARGFTVWRTRPIEQSIDLSQEDSSQHGVLLSK